MSDILHAGDPESKKDQEDAEQIKDYPQHHCSKTKWELLFRDIEPKRKKNPQFLHVLITRTQIFTKQSFINIEKKENICHSDALNGNDTFLVQIKDIDLIF